MVGSGGAPKTDPEGVKSGLLDEFRPFLDESLIIAILGDFDLAIDHVVARKTLSTLAANVEAEEASCIAPGLADLSLDDALSQGQRRLEDVPASSDATDDSSRLCSSHTSQTTPRDGLAPVAAVNLPSVPEQQKEPLLRSIFPNIKPFDVAWELKQAQGDFDRALSALLTIQYLEENDERPRGIEGAFDENPQSRRARRKGKKNGRRETLASGSSSSEAPRSNLRLDIPYTLKPIDLAAADDGDCVPSIKSPRSAPHTPLPRDPAAIAPEPLPQPLTTAKQISDWQTVVSRKQNRAISNGGPSPGPGTSAGARTPTASAAHRSAAGQSFEAAHRAWRRGKSDPLYRPVAVVYAERGHKQALAAEAAQRAEFLARVDAQSTPSSVDLHGTPVELGVEIALARVREWHLRVAPSEEDCTPLRRQQRRQQFVVVTGVGNHSIGGVSRMKKSVLTALALDGWAVEAEHGQLLITGRRKS